MGSEADHIGAEAFRFLTQFAGGVGRRKNGHLGLNSAFLGFGRNEGLESLLAGGEVGAMLCGLSRGWPTGEVRGVAHRAGRDHMDEAQGAALWQLCVGVGHGMIADWREVRRGEHSPDPRYRTVTMAGGGRCRYHGDAGGGALQQAA